MVPRAANRKNSVSDSAFTPSLSELSQAAEISLPAGMNPEYFAGVLIQSGKLPVEPLVEGRPNRLVDFSGLDAGALTFAASGRQEQLVTSGRVLSREIAPGSAVRQRFVLPAERVFRIDLVRVGEWSPSISLLVEGRPHECRLELRQQRLCLFPKGRLRGGSLAEIEVRNASSQDGALRAVEPLSFPLLAGNDSSAGPGLWMRFSADEARPALRQTLRRALILLQRGDYRRLIRAVRTRLHFR